MPGVAGLGKERRFLQVLVSSSAALLSSSLSDEFDIVEFLLEEKRTPTVDDYSMTIDENTWLSDEIVFYYSMTICQRVDQKEKMTIDLLSFLSLYFPVLLPFSFSRRSKYNFQVRFTVYCSSTLTHTERSNVRSPIYVNKHTLFVRIVSIFNRHTLISSRFFRSLFSNWRWRSREEVNRTLKPVP